MTIYPQVRFKLNITKKHITPKQYFKATYDIQNLLFKLIAGNTYNVENVSKETVVYVESNFMESIQSIANTMDIITYIDERMLKAIIESSVEQMSVIYKDNLYIVRAVINGNEIEESGECLIDNYWNVIKVIALNKHINLN